MRIIFYLSTIILLAGCTTLIYAIRGPKYEGKFKIENYIPSLENAYFYHHTDYSEDFKDSIRINGTDTTIITRHYPKHSYVFFRFDNDGKIKIKSINQDEPLERIPTTSEIDTLPVLNEIYYVIKDSLIKYEIYTDSYNGYNLYKSQFYGDYILNWQVGISRLYLKTYKRIKH